jgi:hypothetical protein
MFAGYSFINRSRVVGFQLPFAGALPSYRDFIKLLTPFTMRSSVATVMKRDIVGEMESDQTFTVINPIELQ